MWLCLTFNYGTCVISLYNRLSADIPAFLPTMSCLCLSHLRCCIECFRYKSALRTDIITHDRQPVKPTAWTNHNPLNKTGFSVWVPPTQEKGRNELFNSLSGKMTTVCIKFKVNEHSLLWLARPTAKAIVSQYDSTTAEVIQLFQLVTIPLVKTQNLRDPQTIIPKWQHIPWPSCLFREKEAGTLRLACLECQVEKQMLEGEAMLTQGMCLGWGHISHGNSGTIHSCTNAFYIKYLLVGGRQSS
jgi:hypothetical protein